MHVAVLRATRECETIGRKGKGVHGTEMARDIGKSLVVDYAHQLYAEATLGGLGRRDLTGVLTAGKQHVELLYIAAVEERADCRISARFHKIKDADGLEGPGMEQLGHTITRAGDKHGVVISYGEREDFTFVDLCLNHDLIVLPIMDQEAALVCRYIHGLVEGTP